MLNFSLTDCFAKLINAKTSSDLALPRFTIKFACFDEICAPPIILPFNPQSSISLAAKYPGGLTNIDPALGLSNGCETAFFADILLFYFQYLDARQRQIAKLQK